MMSLRGSRPKIPSGNWTEPAALPSRVVTFSSMSHALLLGRRLGGLIAAGSNLELARLGSLLRQGPLHRITHRNPPALRAGNGALDQDQAALDVGLDDAQVEGGDPIDAHMARHLLVLEGLAGILTLTRRTDRAVRNRHAMRGAKTAKIPALHTAGKTLAN